ncbi:MAG: hypothetical protein AAGF28_03365 [Pseudomonadota bacterium]
MLAFTRNTVIVVLLTMLSQLGGIAWLIALLFKRRILVFSGAHIVLTVATLWIAPVFGRVPITCGAGGPLQMQSWFYCALNRQYVAPELRDVAVDLAIDLETVFPGTVTLALDGNFPFVSGFPLLPHLSHHDGRKLDIAFFYKDASGYKPSATRSPIGYFAFEDGPTQCPQAWLTLRWDLKWLQPFWKKMELEPERMVATINWLAKEPRVGKVFLEPHLLDRYGVSHPKFRFQGCRAARHDDHFHIQL